MAHKLKTALMLMVSLLAGVDAAASAWPTEAAVPSVPVFPVDQLRLQEQIHHLDEQLEQSQHEQAKFVAAMNGLLNAVESLQTRLDAAEAREASRQKAEADAKAEAEKAATAAIAPPQPAGQWVQQSYCTIDNRGRTTCHQRMVWQPAGN